MEKDPKQCSDAGLDFSLNLCNLGKRIDEFIKNIDEIKKDSTYADRVKELTAEQYNKVKENIHTLIIDVGRLEDCYQMTKPMFDLDMMFRRLNSLLTSAGERSIDNIRGNFDRVQEIYTGKKISGVKK